MAGTTAALIAVQGVPILDVIVDVAVGAGPTGLSLACQLVRYNIDFVIFDQKESITNRSKALAVHARTLEIYEQLGIADDAIAEGAIAKRATVVAGGAVRGSLDLSDIGKNLSPFPFALVLEQSKNERLLDDYVRRHGEKSFKPSLGKRRFQNKGRRPNAVFSD